MAPFRTAIAAVAILAAPACISPDTQPVIDATAQVAILSREDAAQHRSTIERFATFTSAEAKADYLAILDARSARQQELLAALLDWAQRVGEFDQAYLDASLERAVEIYLTLTEGDR